MRLDSPQLKSLEALHQREQFAQLLHLFSGSNTSFAKDIMDIGVSWKQTAEPLFPAHLGVQEAVELLGQLSSDSLDPAAFLRLLKDVADTSIKVNQSTYVGHMTSALPDYIPALMYLVTSLNQNQVKLETSGGFTVIEKHVLGELHQQFFNAGAQFYRHHLESSDVSIGGFCSGGTVANLSALWAFRKAWVQAGRSLDKARLYVSELGHYSIAKSLDILGFAEHQLCKLPAAYFQHETGKLELQLAQDCQNGYQVFSLIGIAGATETGEVDDLEALATLSQKYSCFFHVDAAWGGAFGLVEAFKERFKGIEQADSITIDAHKQLYVPIGAGIILFRNSNLLEKIEHHANYILRPGSFDLGQFSLEGSRPAMSLVLFAHFRIIGLKGFNLLFQSLHQMTFIMAEMITASKEFTLTTAPQLNILTYRISDSVLVGEKNNDEDLQNKLVQRIHKVQRQHGATFVSRTKIHLDRGRLNHPLSDVFRVVIANPLTKVQDLQKVLDEQIYILTNDILCLEILGK